MVPNWHGLECGGLKLMAELVANLSNACEIVKNISGNEAKCIANRDATGECGERLLTTKQADLRRN